MDYFFQKYQKVIEETLTPKGFVKSFEMDHSMGDSATYSKDEFSVQWTYDQRGEYYSLRCNGKPQNLNAEFSNKESLEASLLPKLEEWLNRPDTVSAKQSSDGTKKKGLFGLFGKK